MGVEWYMLIFGAPFSFHCGYSLAAMRFQDYGKAKPDFVFLVLACTCVYLLPPRAMSCSIVQTRCAASRPISIAANAATPVCSCNAVCVCVCLS